MRRRKLLALLYYFINTLKIFESKTYHNVLKKLCSEITYLKQDRPRVYREIIADWIHSKLAKRNLFWPVKGMNFLDSAKYQATRAGVPSLVFFFRTRKWILTTKCEELCSMQFILTTTKDFRGQ